MLEAKVIDHMYTGGGVNVFVGEIGEYNFVCEDGGDSVEYFDKSLGINSSEKYADLEDAYSFEQENAQTISPEYDEAVGKAVSTYALKNNTIDYNPKYEDELRRRYSINESLSILKYLNESGRR